MGKSVTRRLVVSAVNFCEGGPLTALRDCLASASETLSPEWEVVALVHDRKLFDLPRVRFIEIPDAKRSWARRLYYEYWHFNVLSKELQPDVWLSLHDTSPRVQATRQLVYCHNPSPFYQPGIREALWEPKFLLFTLFYRYLYRINIHANDLVVVQQDWLRSEFQRLYGLRNVVVAHPVSALQPQSELGAPAISPLPHVFLYPALPRVFKNFEILCEAAKILSNRIGNNFELRLTLSGGESRYAAYLKRRYVDSPVIKFIGRQNHEQMIRQYQEAAAVVFPSRLETWGLPISEAKYWGKVLLVADLPYAHETVGNYDRVSFFDPSDPAQLADLMEQHLMGRLPANAHSMPTPTAPFARNWAELLRLAVGN